jgi:hypothetical protein
MSDAQHLIEERDQDMVADWIFIGGGNSVDPECLLNSGMTPAQVEFIRDWARRNTNGTVAVGFLLAAVGFPFHFDAHPLDEPSHTEEDVAAFHALG